MKFFPHTLLGRTAFYLSLILVVGSVAWTGAIGNFVLQPFFRVYDRQICDTIMMAQRLLERDDSLVEPLTHKPPFSKFVGLRIVADTDPLPRFFNPGQRPLPPEVLEGLRTRLGNNVSLEQEQGSGIIWIRFPAGSRFYWLVVPLPPPGIFPYPLLIWVGGGFALSIGGAYLIIFQLTRRLQHVTDAVRAIGQGQSTASLEETGPQEIRDLSAGFNQMASDLRRHENERRLMLAGISHDLRTPLTRLRIAAELSAPENDTHLTSGMIQDIEEMNSILKQFLDYARDGSEETPVEADLDEIVREICLRYVQAGHSIGLVLGGVPRFDFGPLALRRVVTNLVENAVRYGRTEIEVRTVLGKNWTRIEVSDRGPGVAPERLADISQPFVRESSARSELGAGLGLAIVDRIVRAQGGRVELQNRPEGGFLARVELPLRRDGLAPVAG